MSAPPPAVGPTDDIVLAGRYALGPRLGSGSRGEVFAAHDRVADRAVAIKMLHPTSPEERRRVLREIAALRMLRVPGVVPLLDEGRHGPGHFIVMDRIDGRPFPGADADPEAVVERLRALLTILDRVHAAGIVHRDLKPANVLVEPGGRVVVLDFGLARGAALGATMTASGMVVGTPRYQAPEQMRGLAADARADLYAVGVMAFEALAGRPPHADDSLPTLMRARLTAPAPPLASLTPALPRAVAAVVDRLLERDPAARPGSADEARRGLAAEAAIGWPWLGTRAAIDAAVARLTAGRRCRLGGPRASGRSRALDEVADALTAAGRAVIRLRAGERPFESLTAVVDPSALPGEGPLPERVVAALRALPDAIICADDTIDRWTARALDRLDGPVARVVGDPGDVTLGPVSAAELRPLFAGPARLFHIPEDAAAALIDGVGVDGRALRGDVIAELGRWLREGVVRRDGPRLAVDRAALRRIRSRPRAGAGDLDAVSGPLADVVAAAHLAWPHTTIETLAVALDRPRWEAELAALELIEEGALVARPGGTYEPRAPASALPAWTEARVQRAHARLAAALPPGAAGRLGHVLAGADPAAIVDEASRRALDRWRSGDVVDGLAALHEALRAIRREVSAAEGRARWVAGPVRLMARLALENGGTPEIEAARAELRRPEVAGPEWAPIEAMLDAAAALKAGAPDRARAALAAVPPFTDEAFEVIRHSLRATAAIYESPAASAAALDDLAPWFEARPHLRGRFASWRGNLLYRQGRFAEAAALHLEAADARPDARGRLSCLLNGGLALLEAFDLDRAAAIGETLGAEARRLRMPLFEAFGARITRAVAYRAGAAEGPDAALAEAAGHLEHVTLPALIALNEAAIAWRTGAADGALRLVELTITLAERAGQGLIARLARGIGWMQRPPADMAPIAALAAAGEQVSLPRIGAQLLGMARRIHPAPPPAWAAAARRLADQTPRARWHHPLEVLSLDECVERAP